MTPTSEFQDLLDRSERMLTAGLLLAITFGLFIVSGLTLLFTVFVTLFSMLRNGANKWESKITTTKGATFRCPLEEKS